MIHIIIAKFTSLTKCLLLIYNEQEEISLIKRLQVLHYKAFKYIDINLSNLNILIGPNASGKSTLLDIFILIKDILLRGPIAAVDKRASSLSELLWLKKENRFDIAIEIEIPLNIKEKLTHKSFSIARYEISIQQDKEKGAIIGEENLWLKREQLLNSADNSCESPEYSIKETKEKYFPNHDLYFGKQRELFPAEKKEPKNIFLRRTKPPSGWRKIIIKSIQGNDYFRAETTDWNITYKFGPYRSALAFSAISL